MQNLSVDHSYQRLFVRLDETKGIIPSYILEETNDRSSNIFHLVCRDVLGARFTVRPDLNNVIIKKYDSAKNRQD